MTAQELKTATTRLRCDHRHNVQPPNSLWAPGPCDCGSQPDAEPIPKALREPLAAWLDEYATWYETDLYSDLSGQVHGACHGVIGEDCDCFDHAIAVAKVINRSGP